MAKAVIQSNVFTLNGSVGIAAGASVLIKDAISGSPVQLWSERDGINLVANPVIADSSGFFRVYATAGLVTVEATHNAITQTWADIVVNESVFDESLIVHSPGSGLANEAGTAYASDITTSDLDTTVGSVLKVGAKAVQLGDVYSKTESDAITDLLATQATTYTKTESDALLGGKVDLTDETYYQQDNILGTVSQTAGVPTGAIIERGSNANGDYVKYADGTLICSSVSAVLATTTTASGSIFFAGSQAFTFPAAYTASPVVSELVIRSSGVTWAYGTQSVTTTGCIIGVAGASSTTSGYVGYIAIGRWF